MDRIYQSLIVSINAIWLNRGRSLLTMLGIIIGIAAVVALVSLGRSVEAFVLSEFQSLGSDILTINSARPEDETRTRIDPLTVAEMNQIAMQPSVASTGAEFNVSGQIFAADGETLFATAKGITPNVPELQFWELAAGELITARHVNNLERVAVLGSEAVEVLFPNTEVERVIGELIRTSNQVFEVIGVLEPAGTGVGDVDNAVIVPITTAQQRLSNSRTGGTVVVSTIYVEALDSDQAEVTEFDIHFVLQTSHRIITPDQRDYRITSQAGLLDTIQQITGFLTAFLAAIASISLLVGGIGIMNIMLVTVTERTREIGLRKAVGAQPSDIMIQFLFESLLLSLAGGILGILTAIAMTNLLSALIPDLVVSVQVDAILLATAIASIVGISFGLLPARQAARLNPIDALRYE